MTIVAEGQIVRTARSAHPHARMKMFLEILSSSSKIGRDRALTIFYKTEQITPYHPYTFKEETT